jgi:hypothetical protein
MLEGCQSGVTWQADVTRVTWTHDRCAMCHLDLCLSYTLYSYWNVTRVTPGPSTSQPVVHISLAKMVGEVTRTPRVWDFGTSEYLECIIVERSKGPKIGATWQLYGTLGVRDSGLVRR